MVYAPTGGPDLYAARFCDNWISKQRAQKSGSHRRTSMCLRDTVAGMLSRTGLRNESALADALLHPQDRGILSRSFRAHSERRLRFGRWNENRRLTRFTAGHDEDPAEQPNRATSAPEQYAMAQLFRGTMARHSANRLR